MSQPIKLIVRVATSTLVILSLALPAAAEPPHSARNPHKAVKARRAPIAKKSERARRAETEARHHFSLGQAYFFEKLYGLALEEYQAAHRAWPLPGFLFNIAQCERKLGQNEKAIESYQRYLKAPESAPQRREVEGLIAELRSAEQVARQKASGTPPEPPVVAAVPIAPVIARVVPPPTVAPAPMICAPCREITCPIQSEAPPTLDCPHVTPSSGNRLTRNPWFWVAVGSSALVIGGAIGLGVSASQPHGALVYSLGTADWR